MSIIDKPFEQDTMQPSARLCAAAALLACMLALAAIALCPLCSEKAYADARQPLDIGPVVVTAPAYTGGELLPIELKELKGFPKDDSGAHFAEDGIDKQASGISDVRLDPESGVVIPIAQAEGIAPSDTKFDTVKIKVTGMAAYADSTIEIKVYFRPKLTIHDVTPLNGQYDPKEHGGKKFPGYTRSNTPPNYQTYLDGINATYTDAKGNNTQWKKSWTYAYRHRINSNPMENYSQHIPNVSPYQTYSPQKTEDFESGFEPVTPINAGPYQLVISTPYVQQATAGKADPAAGECAGWIVLEYDVAKAPWHDVRHGGLTLNDESGATDTANILGMGDGHIPDNVGKASFTVANSTYVGLESATVDNVKNIGQLTVVANGKANSTTLVDEVVVNVTNMGNYEDFTVTVPVTYRAKPEATITGPEATITGLAYNGKPHAGYTGEPSARYIPYGGSEEVDYKGDFVVTYSGTIADGTAYGPTNQAPTSAGDYTATFSPALDQPLQGSYAVEFSIAQIPLTFKAVDTSMTAGGSPPEFEYTVEGLLETDGVIQDPSLSIEGDPSKAGFCTIAITGGIVDNQASYQVTYEPGTLTVNAGQKKDEPGKPEVTAKKLSPTGDAAPLGLAVAFAGSAALALGLTATRTIRKRNR